MPVYNESRTLRQIVGRVLAAPIGGEIELLCVDDGSSDRSWELLTELSESDPRIKIFRHPLNRGKGAAIRTAIAQMTGDIAVIQDSDLEYDPADYAKLLKPILDGRADAVFGSRFAASPERRVLLFWHSLGNKALTGLTNILNDLNLTDMETCYKAVRADVLQSLKLRSERFGIEPEIATRLAQWGARIYEVPISYHGRSYEEGKNIGWRDGVQAIWLLFKYRFIDTAGQKAGYETLENIARAKAIGKWTVDILKPFLGQRVLEAGAGMGALTRYLLDRERVVVVDVDRYLIQSLERRWGRLSNISIIEGDIQNAVLYSKLAGENFDTVLCTNVLEHIEDPKRALSGFVSVLGPGGSAVVLVPAHRWLFSQVDEALGHRRRFEKGEVLKLLQSAGLQLVHISEFNRLGVAGWLINKWFGSLTVKRWQAGSFALMMPFARLVERISFLPGLSYIAVAKKT